MKKDENKKSDFEQVLEAISSKKHFLIVSHARPDGDAIGSQLALSYALKQIGKLAHVVCRDQPPAYFRFLPGLSDIIFTDTIEETFDAVIVLECGSLERTEIEGLNKQFLINIDHHIGNSMYGSVNWFDETAAACGEMVFRIISALGIPLTKDIATLLYVTILTDTGSFRHSNITEHTFDICKTISAAGVSPAEVSDIVFQQERLEKLRLTGLLLNQMELQGNGQVAVLNVSKKILKNTGCSIGDLEGLVNLPLDVSEVQAVVLFKELEDGIKVNLRSKGNIDVRTVATQFGGGGHRNAAGFNCPSSDKATQEVIIEDVLSAIKNTKHHTPTQQ